MSSPPPRAWQDRFGWLIIALFLAVTPVLTYGAKGAWDSIKNRLEDWLPDSFEETQRLRWFYNQFGTDELLMISWDGCTLDDPRLEQYKAELTKPDESGDEPVSWFGDVVSGKDALESLTADPLELSHDEALARMEGWLIGGDHSQTCLVAIVSKAGEGNRAAAIDYAYRCADQVEGVSRDEMIIAGPTSDGVAVDNASKNSLDLLNAGSFFVCITIMYLGFRSMRATMIVFLIAIFCEQLSMSIMYFSGQAIDSVLTLVANLTYVLSISSGVHLVNYYRESLVDRSPKESVGWALRAALVPCLLSAGTTAVGMLSLMVSQIRPVTNFGMYAAASIGAGAIVLLLLAPAALYKFPVDPKGWHDPNHGPRWLHVVWNKLSIGIDSARWGIFLGSLAVIGLCLVGVSRIKTSAQLHDLFWPEARIIRDYNWLEDKVGPLVPIEVVLRMPAKTDEDSKGLKLDEEFFILDKAQKAIADVEGIGASMSAATFAPEFPDPKQRGIIAISRRASFRKILESRLDQYVEMHYLSTEGDDHLWRISARVSAGDRLHYGDLMERVKKNVNATLAEHPEIEPIYSGSVPLVFKAQTEMLNDLIKSFGLAFVMIAAIMIILLRNLFTGFFSMVPNILPTLIAFGTMGWLGVPVEVGSLLTASAALGIAVDDSLHFISWFNKGLAAGASRREATRLAYEHCGAAMIQTSLICSFGLLVFALSPFTPISRFAWMMFSLLLIALLCDLFILPAILLCFSKDKPKAEGETIIVPAHEESPARTES
ncbi:MMPL family transporter [Blastopirellula sp. JC732]|uniref:MMPL family transporter n=1 Tax=Blastopirellula sediminis TaxID=2894196 RepID=A0A9X1MKS2_9BACT|nr:MMPL family transporter [Blastopirellula sediminis]MCC9607888.1 MMPL family transporter [Blastopirellula sediminis]MCC9627319.1 MMPL family transporter [Blastopirellula sediminis]